MLDSAYNKSADIQKNKIMQKLPTPLHSAPAVLFLFIVSEISNFAYYIRPYQSVTTPFLRMIFA